MAKRKTKKKSKKFTPQQKEQRQQEREIRNLMINIGFNRIPRINGKEFVYKERTSEMDDIFYYKNIILITEYTIGKPGDHLLKKKVFYDKVNENKNEFICFLLNVNKLKSFKEVYDATISKNYSKKQIQLKIIYCSKQTISQEHKNVVKDIKYFNYHVVKYFESLAKVIKKSAKYEFFEFLEIPFKKIGDNIKSTQTASQNTYFGQILPEEHSSFKEGYKIVSFYIDADSLLKRAYVLRQNGWKEKGNIGHYQRMLMQPKIKSMRKYLHDKERVFINNIIATLSIDKIKLYDKDDNLLKMDVHGN